MCKQRRKCLDKFKKKIKNKTFLFSHFSISVCIRLSSVVFTGNASPLLKAASLPQPHAFSGRGDAIVWAVTFPAQIQCVWAGLRWILLSAALCCPLLPAGTKTPSLFAAFRLKRAGGAAGQPVAIQGTAAPQPP